MLVNFGAERSAMVHAYTTHIPCIYHAYALHTSCTYHAHTPTPASDDPSSPHLLLTLVTIHYLTSTSYYYRQLTSYNYPLLLTTTHYSLPTTHYAGRPVATLRLPDHRQPAARQGGGRLSFPDPDPDSNPNPNPDPTPHPNPNPYPSPTPHQGTASERQTLERQVRVRVS